MAGTLTELAIQSVRNSISCASIDQLTAMSPHDQNRYLAVREHLIHLAPQPRARGVHVRPSRLGRSLFFWSQ
jgi:hypothetical protein